MGSSISGWVGFSLCIAFAAAFAVRARRRGASGLATAVGTFVFFGAAVIALLATLHTLVILSLRIGAWQKGAGFVWDFRTYALFLLAGVLLWCSAALLRCAAGLASGQRSAWRTAMMASSALLAINLPLAPLQAFAIGVGSFALVTLLLLAGTTKKFR